MNKEEINKEEINKEEINKEMLALIEQINKYNESYYINNISEISDFEFDMLLQKLIDLEKENPELALAYSPTKRVGGDITKKFASVVHQYPMLSLSNTYSQEEIQDWENRLEKLQESKITYVCELKYDGVAIGIRYKNGVLEQAVTRGDGIQGEDVTTNVKTIPSIPLKLKGDYPEEFEIRGEIFFPLKNFIELNESRRESGEAEFANPRNTASGTLKMQNSKIVADRGLDCYLYGLYGKNLPFNSHFENVQAAKSWGFKVPDPKKNFISKTDSLEGIESFINYWAKERQNLPFEIDGVVLKVNDYHAQDELGFTAKSPRWAIAYKFKAERVETQLVEVTYQVGRTGAITPVANLIAVALGGTVVRRASLHNADQIEKLDLHEKDFVYVEKGGEIIPKIVGVNLNKRNQEAKIISYLKTCPECNTDLVREEGEAHHYCPNRSACPPQVSGRIQHFISRKALNIEGIGSETVDAMVKSDMIYNYADLYDLDFDKLLTLERMAEKSANNVLIGLEASKQISFERVLFGLGIRFVGETVAKKLVKHFENIENLKNANLEELISVDEIGDRIAVSILEFFKIETNLELMDRLKTAGLQFEIVKKEGTSSILKDKTFVVSGVFSNYSRDQIKELIELNGGKNSSSISSKTDYVLAGENMGPAKLKKATDLNIQILSETDFSNMLN